MHCIPVLEGRVLTASRCPKACWQPGPFTSAPLLLIMANCIAFCAGCALLKLRQGQLMKPRVIIRLCMCQHLFADAFMISLSSHHTYQVQGRQLKPIRRSVCQYAYRNRSSRSYYLHQLWLGPASTVASLPLNT